MKIAGTIPGELKVLMSHVYEYKKGVRQMVLYTFNEKYRELTVNRLGNRNIDYFIQPADSHTLSLLSDRAACIGAVRHMIDKSLNKLVPEEDFILGAMLGYDIHL